MRDSADTGLCGETSRALRLDDRVVGLPDFDSLRSRWGFSQSNAGGIVDLYGIQNCGGEWSSDRLDRISVRFILDPAPFASLQL